MTGADENERRGIGGGEGGDGVSGYVAPRSAIDLYLGEVAGGDRWRGGEDGSGGDGVGDGGVRGAGGNPIGGVVAGGGGNDSDGGGMWEEGGGDNGGMAFAWFVLVGDEDDVFPA